MLAPDVYTLEAGVTSQFGVSHAPYTLLQRYTDHSGTVAEKISDNFKISYSRLRWVHQNFVMLCHNQRPALPSSHDV